MIQSWAALLILTVATASEGAPLPSPPATATSSLSSGPPAAVKPAPYALPWGLRPALAVNVFRADTTIASSNNPRAKLTVPLLLLASKKLTPELAVLLRLGLVANRPEMGENGAALTNPALGVTYARALTPELRLNLFLGATVPVGSGGGDTPGTATRAAILAGIPARSAMDNALFAVNYFTIFPGVALAYVAHGLTLQAEATVLELLRVRGAEVDRDGARTNLTCGVFAGYFLGSPASLGLELRYQRWLENDTVMAVADNPAIDTLTLAFGPRFHFKLSDTLWIRPGVAFELGLDEPLGFGGSGSEYKIVQIDVPVIF